MLHAILHFSAKPHGQLSQKPKEVIQTVQSLTGLDLNQAKAMSFQEALDWLLKQRNFHQIKHGKPIFRNKRYEDLRIYVDVAHGNLPDHFDVLGLRELIPILFENKERIEYGHLRHQSSKNKGKNVLTLPSGEIIQIAGPKKNRKFSQTA